MTPESIAARLREHADHFDADGLSADADDLRAAAALIERQAGPPLTIRTDEDGHLDEVFGPAHLERMDDDSWCMIFRDRVVLYCSGLVVVEDSTGKLQPGPVGGEPKTLREAIVDLCDKHGHTSAWGAVMQEYQKRTSGGGKTP